MLRKACRVCGHSDSSTTDAVIGIGAVFKELQTERTGLNLFAATVLQDGDLFVWKSYCGFSRGYTANITDGCRFQGGQ